MARVAMFAQAFAPVIGGVESHVEDLRCGLEERGHDVMVVCGRGGPAAADLTNRFVRSPAVAGADLFSSDALDKPALKALVADVRARFRPSVLHVHNPNHFDSALAEAVLGVDGPLRRVASVHDRPIEPSCNQILTEDWDHVLFASAYLRDALPRPASSSVLHLGIDTGVFRPDAPTHPDLMALERPLIFHPARLLAWKGILDSASAFVQVHREIGSGTLLLPASNEILSHRQGVREMQMQIMRIFSDAGLADAVVFRDFARTEMPSAYAASDVVWYPTRAEEPYGLVPLEAMACGRPVVVTASGGMRETIADGCGASIIQPGDVAALAEVTISLLRDASLHAEMGVKGVRHVAGLSLTAYLDDLERVYASRDA
jgi:glycosyltransferase involved in cell wall biosynthesis